MRSRNFRNGVAWSYTGYEAHSSCSFLYRCSRTNELLEHQKLDQMIFQKPEHSICTKKYSYRSEINMGVTLRPWVLLIWQNGKIWVLPKKSKTPSKYKHVFSTNEWLLRTYYGIAGAFIHDLKLWNLHLVRFLSLLLSVTATGKCLWCSKSDQISVKREKKN